MLFLLSLLLLLLLLAIIIWVGTVFGWLRNEKCVHNTVEQHNPRGQAESKLVHTEPNNPPDNLKNKLTYVVDRKLNHVHEARGKQTKQSATTKQPAAANKPPKKSLVMITWLIWNRSKGSRWSSRLLAQPSCKQKSQQPKKTGTSTHSLSLPSP